MPRSLTRSRCSSALLGADYDQSPFRDVIYSPEAGRVVGLTLNKRGFLAGRCREVLPAETIHA
jgi:hypothetical protein